MKYIEFVKFEKFKMEYTSNVKYDTSDWRNNVEWELIKEELEEEAMEYEINEQKTIKSEYDYFYKIYENESSKNSIKKIKYKVKVNCLYDEKYDLFMKQRVFIF